MTLDADVAAKLKSLARATGRSFKEIVNENLRAGLIRREAEPERLEFIVEPVLRGLRPGLNLDHTSELLDRLDGPARR